MRCRWEIIVRTFSPARNFDGLGFLAGWGESVEQSGEYRIAAARDVVWRGLNDADVLAKCIDGCQSMEKLSDTQFDTSVKAKIGPVSTNAVKKLSAIFRATPSMRRDQAWAMADVELSSSRF